MEAKADASRILTFVADASSVRGVRNRLQYVHPNGTDEPMPWQISVESAMASAIASVEMEGLTVTAEDRELLQRVASGEITASAAMQQVLEECKQASSHVR